MAEGPKDCKILDPADLKPLLPHCEMSDFGGFPLTIAQQDWSSLNGKDALLHPSSPTTQLLIPRDRAAGLIQHKQLTNR